MLSYYRQIFTTALQGAYGSGSAAAFAVAFAGWVVLKNYPEWASQVNDALVVVPGIVFLILFTVRLILAPYWLHQTTLLRMEQWEQRTAELERRSLDTAEAETTKTLRLIVLDRFREQGEALLDRSHGTRSSDPSFVSDFEEWRSGTYKWIEAQLGFAYAVRFSSESGVPNTLKGTFVDFLNEARSLNARLARLVEFVIEIDGRKPR